MTPIDFYFKDMAKHIVYLEKVRVRNINHLRNRITAAVGFAIHPISWQEHRLSLIIVWMCAEPHGGSHIEYILLNAKSWIYPFIAYDPI